MSAIELYIMLINHKNLHTDHKDIKIFETLVDNQILDQNKPLTQQEQDTIKNYIKTKELKRFIKKKLPTMSNNQINHKLNELTQFSYVAKTNNEYLLCPLSKSISSLFEHSKAPNEQIVEMVVKQLHDNFIKSGGIYSWENNFSQKTKISITDISNSITYNVSFFMFEDIKIPEFRSFTYSDERYFIIPVDKIQINKTPTIKNAYIMKNMPHCYEKEQKHKSNTELICETGKFFLFDENLQELDLYDMLVKQDERLLRILSSNVTLEHLDEV